MATGDADCLFVAGPVIFYSSLMVEGDAQDVRLFFGMGIIRRTIPRQRIAQAEQVRNSWWYGWGIRLTPHGWMWSISGLDAVELTSTAAKISPRYGSTSSLIERTTSYSRPISTKWLTHKLGWMGFPSYSDFTKVSAKTCPPSSINSPLLRTRYR